MSEFESEYCLGNSLQSILASYWLSICLYITRLRKKFV